MDENKGKQKKTPLTSSFLKHYASDNAEESTADESVQSTLDYFGRYQIIKEIGHGGMGKVYQAYDPMLERMVALKVLLEKGPCAKSNQRFLREAKANAKLDHPNIVRIYDIGNEKGQFYFTMEFITGPSLKQFINKCDYNIAQLANIMIKICEGVGYAHKQNIVHRDLKPSNIMMAVNETPKVMDFGLAKLIEQTDDLSESGMVIGTLYYMSPEQAQGKIKEIDGRSDIYASQVAHSILDALEYGHQLNFVHRDIKPENIMLETTGTIKLVDLGLAKIIGDSFALTKTGSFLGTPCYMAPEQMRDAKHLDQRVDIYSLGATLYYMVSGEHPYGHLNNRYAIMEAKVNNRIVPLSQYCEDLPQKFLEMVAKAMAHKPENRYQSAREMKNIITSF